MISKGNFLQSQGKEKLSTVGKMQMIIYKKKKKKLSVVGHICNLRGKGRIFMNPEQTLATQ